MYNHVYIMLGTSKVSSVSIFSLRWITSDSSFAQEALALASEVARELWSS